MNRHSMPAGRRSTGFVSAALLALTLASCGEAETPAAAAPDLAKLASLATNDIEKTPELKQLAMSAGKDLFDKTCADRKSTRLNSSH